jgi:molecular chaperone GrpE (heat shock protein)
MSEHSAPRLNKTPFLIGDALLLAVAAWLAFRSGPPLELLSAALVASCVALGAWLGALPFLTEFRAAVKFAETDHLASTVEQVSHLRAVGEQISAATARWQSVQESADKTARTAKEMAEHITTEARHFSEFMQKAQASQVSHLQLEVDKLHRAESEWLQVAVRMLDHVYALYSAAVRAGQPGLIEQLGHFQLACRDAARRVGLTPFEPAPDAPFDEKVHQLPDEATAAEEARIAQVLATGYTYQGQLVRRALVLTQRAVPAAA